jgi:hypothetical protein
MNQTVTLTREQWAGVIRLMIEGQQEAQYFVGSDEEHESLVSAICAQTAITEGEALDMEPPRNYYVPKGEAA